MFCFQKAGADALELNLSCPHGMGERGMGLACGQVRSVSQLGLRLYSLELKTHCPQHTPHLSLSRTLT